MFNNNSRLFDYVKKMKRAYVRQRVHCSTIISPIHLFFISTHILNDIDIMATNNIDIIDREALMILYYMNI
jgi:hypothetical protein